MNKKILLMLVPLVFLLMTAVPTVLADVDVVIDGTGDMDCISTIEYDDDASALFEFHGFGSFELIGAGRDNTGYPYMGVDKTITSVTSDLSGGGWMEFEVNRTDSYGGYGLPGQRSYSFVGSNDVASLDFRTITTYANLYSSNFGFQANQQFYAAGSGFTIEHVLETGSPNEYGRLLLTGSGVASVDYMTDGYTNYNGYKFGYGDGCYENADLTATGSGTLTIGGQADNTMAAHDGSWSGANSHFETWTWNSETLTVDDYAFSGN